MTLRLWFAATPALVACLTAVQTPGRAAPTPLQPPPFQPPTSISPLPALSLPPPPLGPTSLALGQAYSAIGAAQIVNPNAARQAQFAYAEALARYRAGDFASARAEAARAMALASAPVPTPVAPLSLPNATSAFVPALPLTVTGLLPDYLTEARNEIERVELRTGDPLANAKATYRRALNRYLDGDAAGAKRAARDAYEQALAAGKAHDTTR